jgi:hypothetical protein
MLFFHKEEQLIETIKHCAVFLLIIGEWFPQPDKCKATFVFNFVAHE